MTAIMSGRVLFAATLLFGAVVLLVMAWSLGRIAALVPLAVLVPTIGALGVQVAFELRDGRDPAPAASEVGRGRREAVIVAWTGGLLGLVYAVGFVTAFPLFTLLYLRIRAHESWPVSIAMAVAMWGVVAIVFERLLQAAVYEGRLWACL